MLTQLTPGWWAVAPDYKIDKVYHFGNVITGYACGLPYSYTTQFQIESLHPLSGISEEAADIIMVEHETSDGDGQIYYPNFEGLVSVTKSSKAALNSKCRSLNLPTNNLIIVKEKR